MVAADDGVMPQTVEAIDHAKAAGVPIVVAINKIDKANANQDKVKKDLSDHGIMVEEWGGDVVAVPMSALRKEGIDEMVEILALTADILDLKADPGVAARGAVLEARKDPGKGNLATVLVQTGTLHIGDVFVAGATWGRVRAMHDDRGQRIKEAGPSSPVEVTGFGDLPAAGDALQVVENEAKARSVAEFRYTAQRKKLLAPTHGSLSLEQLFERIQEGTVEELPIILRADAQGSLEVLRDTLAKIGNREGEGKDHPWRGRRDHHRRRLSGGRLARHCRRFQRAPRALRRRHGLCGGHRCPNPYSHLRASRRV